MSAETLAPLRRLVTAHDLTSVEGSFAVSYGSSVLGSESSDYDLLIVTGTQIPVINRDRFTQDLMALHAIENRELDGEVPYDNKLFYTHREVREALELPFAQPLSPGQIAIKYLDQMDDDDPYFESPEMKQRLAFNAFTSTHEFLAGDKMMYLKVLLLAQQSFAKLLCHMRAGDPRQPDELLRISPDGVSGKDYLGYVDLSQLKSTSACSEPAQQ